MLRTFPTLSALFLLKAVKRSGQLLMCLLAAAEFCSKHNRSVADWAQARRILGLVSSKKDIQ